MERNINDVNREPFGQRLAEFRAAGLFGDLTKKLVSSAGEKAASAVGAKAGEAIGNKLFSFKKKKPKSSDGGSKAVKENKGTDRDVSRSLTPGGTNPERFLAPKGGIELVKLLQAENEKPLRSNIHEIYKRLLSDE